MKRLQGVIENKNREIAVLSKQLKTARDQVSALKSSVTNLTNEKVNDLNSWSFSPSFPIIRQLQKERHFRRKDRLKSTSLFTKLKTFEKHC